jgi:hypothetical protein
MASVMRGSGTSSTMTERCLPLQLQRQTGAVAIYARYRCFVSFKFRELLLR